MSNRIKDSSIGSLRLSPADADIGISVSPERLVSITQVRGRWVGPRCAYASTVEVAYPLREQSRYYESEGIPRLHLRVIIPEPSFWDPQSPFLYRETLELFDGKEMCERKSAWHGLRSVRLTPQGLRCNGKPLVLRGLTRLPGSEDEARALHQAGYNLLLLPATEVSPACLDLADRFGFLLLARMSGRQRLPSEVQRHACWLGIVLAPEVLHDPFVQACGISPILTFLSLVGLERGSSPPDTIPEEISFLVSDQPLAAETLPQIIMGPERDRLPDAGLLGWISTDV